MSLQIIGTGRALPKRQVHNDELATFLDTGDAWIYPRTGIKSRAVCTDESLTDLAVTAAERAMARARLTADGIGMIIGSTLNGDYISPSLACCVAERLGVSCAAFDINAACTGFIYALDIAAKALRGNDMGAVLIVCAEQMSKHVDWRDRSTCVLFGDGAGACVVTDGDAMPYCHIGTQGDSAMIAIPTGSGNSPFAGEPRPYGMLHMNGQEVFKFAVTAVSRELERAQAAVVGEIDYYILHQANRRIVEAARAKLKQPEEKFPMNIERCGNTSSASIPILLDEMVEKGSLQTGHRLFLTAFGAGLTYGSCIIDWK